MGFDRVDVLDELALYPDRRTHGMSRPELLDALGADDSEGSRLGMLLSRMSTSGHVRQVGANNRTRWQITTRGMRHQPSEDWSGEHWAGWNGSDLPQDEDALWDEAA